MASASDNFNRANESPLAAPWTKQGAGGVINLVSNAITKATQNDSFYYYAGAASTADQFSQATMATQVLNGDWGPAVRVGGSGITGYFYEEYSSSAGLMRHLSGSFTQLTFTSPGLSSPGDVLRIEVSGSTLTAKRNGTTRATVTDTSLTSGQPGLFYFENSGSVDDWSGGDLGGGAAHVVGAATLALVLTRTTVGRRKAKGAATLALTLSRTAAARRKAKGAATLALTLTRSAAGRRKAKAAATLALTMTRTATARRKAKASAQLALTLTRSAAGRRKAKAAAVLPLTLTTTAAGFVGRIVTAAASMGLTFTATVVGRRKARASSSASFTLTTTAGARRKAKAAATSAVALTITARGKGHARAAATLALDLVLRASGVARGPVGYGHAAVTAVARWAATLTSRHDGATLTASKAGAVRVTAREI